MNTSKTGMLSLCFNLTFQEMLLTSYFSLSVSFKDTTLQFKPPLASFCSAVVPLSKTLDPHQLQGCFCGRGQAEREFSYRDRQSITLLSFILSNQNQAPSCSFFSLSSASHFGVSGQQAILRKNKATAGEGKEVKVVTAECDGPLKRDVRKHDRTCRLTVANTHTHTGQV